MKITLIMLLCLMSCAEPHIVKDLERCTVSRVIDGDTFICDDTRVRLAGIDAPELDEHHGQKSYDILKEMIDDKVVWLDITGIGHYGRTIAYVGSVNKYLVKNGYAKNSSFEHKYSEHYGYYEAGAKRHQKGIWAY